MTDGDLKLTCGQCGTDFTFTRGEQAFYQQRGFNPPRYCRDCRQVKRAASHAAVTCVQCDSEIEAGKTVYCEACLTSSSYDSELKAKKSRTAASAAHAKLAAAESQRAEVEESLRQKEQLVSELEVTVDSLSKDLDKAYKFTDALGALQPMLGRIEQRLEALNRLEEKLESLEFAQEKIKERMLQIAQRMHELSDNTGLLDVFKRSLRHQQRETV